MITFSRSLRKLCPTFDQQYPIRSECWRPKARSWENPKFYPPKLHPGLRSPSKAWSGIGRLQPRFIKKGNRVCFPLHFVRKSIWKYIWVAYWQEGLEFTIQESQRASAPRNLQLLNSCPSHVLLLLLPTLYLYLTFSCICVDMCICNLQLLNSCPSHVLLLLFPTCFIAVCICIFFVLCQSTRPE